MPVLLAFVAAVSLVNGGAFSLSSPFAGQGQVSGAPTFQWTSSANATGYRLEVFLGTSTTPVLDVTTSATRYSVQLATTPLQPAKTYTWRVTATSAYGSEVAAGSPAQFTTGAAPVPILTSYSQGKRYEKPDGSYKRVSADIYSPVRVSAGGWYGEGFAPVASFSLYATSGSKELARLTLPRAPYPWEGHIEFDVNAGASFKARMILTDTAGRQGMAEISGRARDILVLAMGDSYGAGEGNPDLSIAAGGAVFSYWEDDACHRSGNAPASLFAEALEDADTSTSVTFKSVACSGAETTHLTSSTYKGYAPQILQLKALLERPDGVPPRDVDLLVISIGGNDFQFGPIISHCVFDAGEFWESVHSCPDDTTWGALINSRRDVPARMLEVVKQVVQHLPTVKHIVFTEYPDPTHAPYHMPLTPPDLTFIKACEMLHYSSNPDMVIWPSEAEWLGAHFGSAINEVVLSTVARAQAIVPAGMMVSYVPRIWEPSIPHGYCASGDNRWVHTEESS
jgi:hypothetical protein